MLSLFKIKASRTFTSGDNTPERLTLITPTVGGPYRFHPVLKLAVGDLKAGDVLDVGACTVQVSSRMPYNLMVASVLILTGTQPVNVTSNMQDYAPYHEVTEGQGMNIDKNIHHYPIQRTALWTVPVDIANAHLNLIVYAASTAYDGVSTLKVDQDYGRLEVAVHREVTPAQLQNFLNTGTF